MTTRELMGWWQWCVVGGGSASLKVKQNIDITWSFICKSWVFVCSFFPHSFLLESASPEHWGRGYLCLCLPEGKCFRVFAHAQSVLTLCWMIQAHQASCLQSVSVPCCVLWHLLLLALGDEASMHWRLSYRNLGSYHHHLLKHTTSRWRGWKVSGRSVLCRSDQHKQISQ